MKAPKKNQPEAGEKDKTLLKPILTNLQNTLPDAGILIK
jgi:hypothetical protein